MNKIFRHIIILSLAVLGLSACTKDTFRDRNATLSLDIRVVSSGTKTTGSGTIDGTEAEAYTDIDHLRLFLVPAGSSGTPADDAAVTEISSSDFFEEDGKVKVFLSASYKGGWLLFAIANWPSGISLNTTTYADFIGTYSSTSSNLQSIWTDYNFLMVNRQNETDGCAGVPIDLDEQSLDVTVYLERVAVKIIARDSDMIDFAPYHTAVVGTDNSYAVSSMEIKQVALLNCVNSFYLTQRWAEPVTGEQSLVTPSSSLDYSLADGYYYKTPSGTSADLVWVDLGTPMYCLENNSPLYADFDFTGDDYLLDKKAFAIDGTKMKGRVTGVVFKAQFKVASGFKSGLGTDPVDPDDGDPGVWNETKALGAEEEAKTLYKYKSTYFADTDAMLARFADDFTGVDMNDFAALRAKGVNIYENGYVYYTYWITDPNYTYTVGAESRPQIAVMRNTCYDLVVTNVSAFGDEMPCTAEYNPQDPLDTKYPKISLSIKITDWDDEDYHYNL